MGYPQYYVTLRTVLKKEDASATMSQVMVDGTHAFQVEARGGTFNVSLEHVNEKFDRIPNLIITFSNE